MDQTNKVLFTISCILIAISLFIAIQISYSVPQFETMFKAFDVDLPENTRNVLEYHYLGFVAPLIAFIASIYLVKSKLNQTSKNIVYTLSIIAFITTISWQAYTAEAVYSPIMQMETNEYSKNV